jgi:hypothetical protein
MVHKIECTNKTHNKVFRRRKQKGAVRSKRLKRDPSLSYRPLLPAIHKGPTVERVSTADSGTSPEIVSFGRMAEFGLMFHPAKELGLPALSGR